MREPAHRRLLDTVIAAFVADCRARNLSPATIDSYLEGFRSYRSTLEPALPDQTLADLEIGAARAWVGGLTERCRPATVANRVRALKVLSRWCVSEGYLRDDHLIRLRRPSVPRTVVEPFTDDQVRVMLGAAPTALAITLRILLDTGLRISEAVGLELRDVGGGYLRVTGKGGHERLVPIGRELNAALRRYVSRERRSRTTEPSEPLLLQRSGRPQTTASVYHAMRRLAVATGVTGVRVSPHTCRHTFATNFLRNGGNVLALQRVLGHRDLAMVRKYAEVTDADVASVQAVASPLDRWSRPRAGHRGATAGHAARWRSWRQDTM